MAITDTQQTAQFAAEAAVSAAEAKQYLIEAEKNNGEAEGYAQSAETSATNAALSSDSAAASALNAAGSETNAAASATSSAESASQAAEYADNASDYARNKFTFYKTSSDPDGTIAGLAATTDGQSFWVAQGPDALSAAWQYQNKAGVAVLQAKQPGTAAVTGTIREFPTLAAAQADADAGNILDGAKCWVTNSADATLADEYINNAGTLVATGRKMPSQASTLFGNLDGWANSSLNPFTTFSSPNPNRLTITSAAAATTTYRGASTGLAVAVADGGSLKMAFTYTGPSTNPNLYLRLQAKDGTTWVSSEITISPSAYLQNIEIPVSGGEAATLYCYVRATAALTADLWMLAYTATNNGTTDFILRVLNNELDFGIGVASKWTTSLFDTFTVNGVNSLTYETLTAKYASASAPLSVATGEKIDIYYRVTGATGNPPIVKLVSGSSDASATATLSPSSTVGKVTLTATSDATQVLFYVANTAASKGVLWFVAQRATATKSNEYPVKHIIESLNALLPFSENALPVMSGMSSFLATSQNSWTFGATGAAYAEVATAFPAKSAGAVLKFAYAIKSNASATYARLRAGSTFVGDETLLTTDGKLHELDLTTTAGSKAEKLVIYSRTGTAYTGTAFVSLLAENGVYVSSVAAMEKLAGVLTLDPPPYVESSSPIANAVMQTLTVTS